MASYFWEGNDSDRGSLIKFLDIYQNISLVVGIIPVLMKYLNFEKNMQVKS